ncbi:MAG TPA: DUF5615 family PIN-like protein [Xanthobacteraceae bacterium]|jgi:predicted nuclease of predicted toxin-antitoxin system
MRFLADENFPGDAVRQLESAGHEVLWIRIVAPGSKDEDIFARAAREGWIVLTFDKDFGELVWRAKMPAAFGVVLFRLPLPPAADVGKVLARRLGERNDWAGHFSVIEPERVRMRPLPKK